MNTPFRARPPAPGQTPENKVDQASVQALFEEIDSEVKVEQLQNFLKTHGKLLIAGVLVLVLGVTGFNAWLRMHADKQVKDTETLIALIDRDIKSVPDDEAKAIYLGLEKMGDTGTGEGHRALARFAEAGMLMQAGKADAAIEVLKMLRADSSIRPLYRDYALLLSIRARLGTGDPQVLIDELKPILTTENPWRLSACELAAMLHARKGDKAKAVEFLASIIDTPDAPLAAIERARSLSRLYTAP